MIACVVIFFLQTLKWGGIGAWIMSNLALWPLGTPEYVTDGFRYGEVPQFGVWQLITYGFLHGSEWHLLFNMFAFWMFGTVIEEVWGSRRFAVFYFICIVGAGLVQLAVSAGALTPTVGASGGVFGLLLAFGVLFPNEKLFFILCPVPIKAKYFVAGYGSVELVLGLTREGSSIAHFAHLGGMFFGLLLILYWKGKLPFKPRPGKLF
ncbi:rhomboid family intramembrane serine protease [Rubellicoccus peritrichatus]